MRPPPTLAIALLLLGSVVFATSVPGVFSVDDNNYLVTVLSLRQGRVTVANTDGLSPSRELLFFDPGPWERGVALTPVASTAPPLYAFIALPFSWLGWRGLVALNTIAYLGAIVIVFFYAKRYASDASTPWVAAAAFALGGYAIEYAQGLWPHALSIALCTAGLAAAGRTIDVREGGSASMAALAGFLLALATGVRYQNAIVLGATAGAVAIWSARRVTALTTFTLAAALPLSVSAAINHARLGSWNPISKGPGYMNVPAFSGAAGSLFDPLIMFWARVVDFSVRPPLVGPFFSFVTYDPNTGAHLMTGDTLQKALLQSAPWAVLAFIVLAIAWMPGADIPDARRRQLQYLSVVTTSVLAVFAFSGVRRQEGLSFNQRYLLELLPVAAIAFAWALDGLAARARLLLMGSLWGVLIVALIVSVALFGHAQLKYLALLRFPLLLASTLAVLWFIARSHESVRPWLATTAGVCLGWGLALHLTEDVAASHRLRARTQTETHALAAALGNGSALVAYSGGKDAAGPLLFDRDIVVLDTRADQGRDAPMLIRELLARNRRVFVLRTGFPDEVLARVVAGRHVTAVAQPGVTLLELR